MLRLLLSLVIDGASLLIWARKVFSKDSIRKSWMSCILSPCRYCCWQFLVNLSIFLPVLVLLPFYLLSTSWETWRLYRTIWLSICWQWAIHPSWLLLKSNTAFSVKEFYDFNSLIFLFCDFCWLFCLSFISPIYWMSS